ncbi:MAG TPA: desulfoferrodoxin [Thermotogota bacterium]|nr:desulfoferrodoxin [Thermotogota bacterium]HPJ88444.1 desulfoferrodoxin [Thermotogota bacterium]HPR95389.1 desulfoferrodoxin [Thermotogota bacterium]
MTEKKQVYKCEKCGNIVEVLHEGPGTLVCCGEPMILLEEKKADSTTEKHVPVVEKTETGYKVTVGSTLHPMLEAHYIEWIELITDRGVFRKHLAPGEDPVAEFENVGEVVKAREYCNVHGLWVNEL